jgi:hypothetical protein
MPRAAKTIFATAGATGAANRAPLARLFASIICVTVSGETGHIIGTLRMIGNGGFGHSRQSPGRAISDPFRTLEAALDRAAPV